jgi:hypothetical protein
MTNPRRRDPGALNYEVFIYRPIPCATVVLTVVVLYLSMVAECQLCQGNPDAGSQWTM